jgi:hypothetical protein
MSDSILSLRERELLGLMDEMATKKPPKMNKTMLKCSMGVSYF